MPSRVSLSACLRIKEKPPASKDERLFFEVNGVDYAVDFAMCIIFTPP